MPGALLLRLLQHTLYFTNSSLLKPDSAVLKVVKNLYCLLRLGEILYPQGADNYVTVIGLCQTAAVQTPVHGSG